MPPSRRFQTIHYAYNMTAALATAKGDHPQALQYLQAASSRAPNDPLILMNLGDAHRKAGESVKAKQAYSQVLALEGVDDSVKAQARESVQQLEATP